MPTFDVTFTTTVRADDPHHAVAQARAAQWDPRSDIVFEVRRHGAGPNSAAYVVALKALHPIYPALTVHDALRQLRAEGWNALARRIENGAAPHDLLDRLAEIGDAALEPVQILSRVWDPDMPGLTRSQAAASDQAYGALLYTHNAFCEACNTHLGRYHGPEPFLF